MLKNLFNYKIWASRKEDWELLMVGQRVKNIKRDHFEVGVLELGIEVDLIANIALPILKQNSKFTFRHIKIENIKCLHIIAYHP